jgi:hypothetical protein
MGKSNNLEIGCQRCEENEVQKTYFADVPKKLLFVNETLAQVTFAHTQETQAQAREIAANWIKKIKEFCDLHFFFIVYVKGFEPIKIHSHNANP